MARTNATNFSGGLQFPYATAATDLFKKEDVQVLAQAVDQHDHSSGKGLALPTGSITSGMIADGTIQTADIADGMITLAKLAANSVDSSKIVDGSIGTADLVAHAASLGTIAVDSSSQQTTSTVPVALPLMSVSFTTVSANNEVLVMFVGTFSHATAGAIQYIYLQQDALGYSLLARTSTPGANYLTPVAVLQRFVVATAAAHTFNVGWATSGGTLGADTAAFRYLLAMEFRR